MRAKLQSRLAQGNRAKDLVAMLENNVQNIMEDDITEMATEKKS